MGASNARGYEKIDDFWPISRCISNGYSQMGTCSETIYKHQLCCIIQHLAWLPQGRTQGKQKCGLWYVKTASFCTCGSNNWETVEDRWVHAAIGLASIELSFRPCNMLRDNRRGVSRRNKNVGCGMWKRRFFALAVRITGKRLKTDGYMLR